MFVVERTLADNRAVMQENDERVLVSGGALSTVRLAYSSTSSVLLKDGDEGKVTFSLRDMIVPKLKKSYDQKGISMWLQYLGSRGWSHDMSDEMSVYLTGKGVGHEEKIRLLILYACWLKERGLIPKVYFQALQHDFEIKGVDISYFKSRAIMEARKTVYIGKQEK
jgi:DNA phosphorothioation-dependent restriction protein DptG